MFGQFLHFGKFETQLAMEVKRTKSCGGGGGKGTFGHTTIHNLLLLSYISQNRIIAEYTPLVVPVLFYSTTLTSKMLYVSIASKRRPENEIQCIKMLKRVALQSLRARKRKVVSLLV